MSQTASYSITTLTGDDDSSSETGTESLGSGGSIDDGDASVSWSDANSTGRTLGISGISTVLSVQDSSTDTVNFAESGTESITAGGQDAPGSMNFDWSQMGTDSYYVSQANAGSSSSTSASSSAAYALVLTDTVSASWDDDGTYDLTDNDSVTGQTDSYAWDDLHSYTYGVVGAAATSTETEGTLYDSTTVETVGYSGSGMQSFSLTEDGADTLTIGAPETFSAPSGWDSYSFGYAFNDSSSMSDSGYFTPGPFVDNGLPALTASNTEAGSDSFSLGETGSDSESGSQTYASDSYTVNDYDYLYDWQTLVGWSGDQTVTDYGQALVSSTLNAAGTDSPSLSTVTYGTATIEDQGSQWESNSETGSSAGFDWLYSVSGSDTFSDTATGSYTELPGDDPGWLGSVTADTYNWSLTYLNAGSEGISSGSYGGLILESNTGETRTSWYGGDAGWVASEEYDIAGLVVTGYSGSIGFSVPEDGNETGLLGPLNTELSYSIPDAWLGNPEAGGVEYISGYPQPDALTADGADTCRFAWPVFVLWLPRLLSTSLSGRLPRRGLPHRSRRSWAHWVQPNRRSCGCIRRTKHGRRYRQWAAGSGGGEARQLRREFGLRRRRSTLHRAHFNLDPHRARSRRPQPDGHHDPGPGRQRRLRRRRRRRGRGGASREPDEQLVFGG